MLVQITANFEFDAIPEIVSVPKSCISIVAGDLLSLVTILLAIASVWTFIMSTESLRIRRRWITMTNDPAMNHPPHTPSDACGERAIHVLVFDFSPLY